MSLSMVILTRIKILRDLNAYDSQSMQVLTDETEGNISLQGKNRLFFYNQPLQTHFLWSTIADDRNSECDPGLQFPPSCKVKSVANNPCSLRHTYCWCRVHFWVSSGNMGFSTYFFFHILNSCPGNIVEKLPDLPCGWIVDLMLHPITQCLVWTRSVCKHMCVAVMQNISPQLTWKEKNTLVVLGNYLVWST